MIKHVIIINLCYIIILILYSDITVSTYLNGLSINFALKLAYISDNVNYYY